ncbi:alpha/beta fold hydrolase [Clostridium ganghwense]|uniref:Alpha/beta hydrolase n=1 Tax=Clostridium ganghwense TaxID=312089 RepID=A0ABT4CL14_9CLOT|nr:alpha/beta hydrolase [Clostridium ganghwense]MCY6369740.1 alpha/beta hydrolase [Clostridium ganghwense]
MSYILTDDNTKIFYKEKGEGRPIVFIHGWASSLVSFAIPAFYLSKKFKVITYDLRGHGKSDATEEGLTMKRFAADLEQLLEALDLNDVILVGWSMGAQVLFEYIKNFGCRRLKGTIIIDMAPKLMNDNWWNLGLYRGKFTHEDNLQALKEMTANWETYIEKFTRILVPDLDEKQFKYIMKGTLINNPNVAATMWDVMVNADYCDVLQKITVPTLIMYGEKSTLYSEETAKYLNNQIPNSRVEKFKGCTHLLVMEDTQKFIEEVDKFEKKINK